MPSPLHDQGTDRLVHSASERFPPLESPAFEPCHDFAQPSEVASLCAQVHPSQVIRRGAAVVHDLIHGEDQSVAGIELIDLVENLIAFVVSSRLLVDGLGSRVRSVCRHVELGMSSILSLRLRLAWLVLGIWLLDIISHPTESRACHSRLRC